MNWCVFGWYASTTCLFSQLFIPWRQFQKPIVFFETKCDWILPTFILLGYLWTIVDEDSQKKMKIVNMSVVPVQNQSFAQPLSSRNIFQSGVLGVRSTLMNRYKWNKGHQVAGTSSNEIFLTFPFSKPKFSCTNRADCFVNILSKLTRNH